MDDHSRYFLLVGHSTLLPSFKIDARSGQLAEFFILIFGLYLIMIVTLSFLNYFIVLI